MARNDGSTIAEILEGGIIVACDEETGILVQGNGSYFNLYCPTGEGRYECRDAQPVCNFVEDETTFRGMYGMNAAQYWDIGKEALADWLNRECPNCGAEREKRTDDAGERIYVCPDCDE